MSNKSIQFSPAADSLRLPIVQLLQQAKLPAHDLPALTDGFIVARQEETIAGLAGLEQYADCGLLRSLLVVEHFRGTGLAKQLVAQIEALAASQQIVCIYLLTETAAAFFDKLGYTRISREEVPAALQQSSEFSYVCPQSAIVMKKKLVND